MFKESIATSDFHSYIPLKAREITVEALLEEKEVVLGVGIEGKLA